MRFVFSRRFYFLLAAGFVPLAAAWSLPGVTYAVLAFDLILICAAVVDSITSKNLTDGLSIRREFDRRFAIGDAAKVSLHIENTTSRPISLRIKDEYPAEMRLEETREADFEVAANGTAEFYYHLTPGRRGRYQFGKTALRSLSRLGLVWCQTELGEAEGVKVYPNMRRAREMELKALGARSFLAIQRRAVRRGEGREFESMRDYVRGDELRHISWTATARRHKLTTRQYQIERDQTVIIVLDAGRLMTGRIGGETKFDTALHASLALMSACARAGDNCGLLVFGRRVRKFLPPKRGPEHLDAVLEALHDLEPELIEPSYARAFQFIASSTKKRSFVVVLTDLVDKDSSKELITSLKLLRPRHLPMVATIGDRDLNLVVNQTPKTDKDVFTQSAAEEIIYQREAALRMVETVGGLAVDVTAQTLAPKLLETYLRVKERGML
ncbi:MAG TPA: DUF58 domain-containing protein [Pyrinomonadaceae bacterium]|nr:DUF58 domain-containing protein [Pyrinomonadaceae bacterium]